MNFSKSIRLLEKAKEIIPVQSQTFSKSWKYYPFPVSPIYIDHAKGSHVWDADGNEFIDFICGLCPITLGWNYPAVDKAIKKQLKKGITFSLPSPLEIELSEIICDIIPSAGAVRFMKTGSEACQAAVRIARAYTGREHILSFGYHGWHSEFSVITERPKGIPKSFANYIHEFEYNNIESLEKLFFGYKDKVACVIMEPVIIQHPVGRFLQDVSDMAHINGALLCFDETVTGFRFPDFSAQNYFGVTPDISVFGKGCANGMPLSFVCGRKDIMREFEDVFVSGTFHGECLSLAACIATIKEMQSKRVIDHIWYKGRYIITKLREYGFEIGGYPCRVAILNKYSDKGKALLLQELFADGIMIHSNLVLNICYSHSKKDCDKLIDSLVRSSHLVCGAEMNDNIDNLLKGSIIQPAFRRI